MKKGVDLFDEWVHNSISPLGEAKRGNKHRISGGSLTSEE